MATKFVVEFAKQAAGQKGVIAYGTARAAATCAAEIVFVFGTHSGTRTDEHWFLLTRGRLRASWKNPNGAWVTVTRVKK